MHFSLKNLTSGGTNFTNFPDNQLYTVRIDPKNGTPSSHENKYQDAVHDRPPTL